MLQFVHKWFGASIASRKPKLASLQDMLGRPAITLDTPEMQRFLAGKRVMVTGAGGSIGSEICRQIMKFCPACLILLERCEGNLFEVDRELRERWIGADLRPVVADICDRRRIFSLFESLVPQVIFHCAAHKHVPMMESNPCEAIRNNVLGTKCVVDAAAAVDAEAFVMVSSDKAVNPTSVMGATKRVAELYVQAMNAKIEDRGLRIGGSEASLQSSILYPQFSTRFTAVRFGNVIGSSGSVLPIFQRQIESGGPVTVTHPDMKRYFMTIPEASQLVMQAGAIGQGGEIFVLDMGEPIRILDLARELIARNGLIAGKDIDIQFTGIRPGEKLYEELSCDNEQVMPTPHDKIHVWKLPPADPVQVQEAMQLLSNVVYAAPELAVKALLECVPEYSHQISQPDPVPTLRVA